MGEAKPLADELQRKAIDPTCPSCRRSEWLHSPETAYVTFAPDPAVRPDTDFREALVLICTYCGFMRFHRATVLRGQISTE